MAMLRLKHAGVSGVYNIGTGVQLTFKDIAESVQRKVGVENAQIMMLPMPDDVVKNYQWHSCANLNKLQSVITDWRPQTVDAWLDNNFESLYTKVKEEIL
jgi:nucleoside-diphosphate-sugar epimerase